MAPPPHRRRDGQATLATRGGPALHSPATLSPTSTLYPTITPGQQNRSTGEPYLGISTFALA
eukprot:12891110-Prorocentrum_lima.AAC.1